MLRIMAPCTIRVPSPCRSRGRLRHGPPLCTLSTGLTGRWGCDRILDSGARCRGERALSWASRSSWIQPAMLLARAATMIMRCETKSAGDATARPATSQNTSDAAETKKNPGAVATPGLPRGTDPGPDYFFLADDFEPPFEPPLEPPFEPPLEPPDFFALVAILWSSNAPTDSGAPR
jgi:hypothetical protein